MMALNLVGQAIGAGRLAVARSTAITGIVLAFALAAAAATALGLSADAVAGLYSTDAEVRAVAATLIVLVGGYHLFDAVQAVTVNALRGYKRAVVPFLINVVGLWIVGLAGGYAMALTHGVSIPALGVVSPLGVRGFWLGAIVGMLVASACTVGYLLAVSAPREARARPRGTVRRPV